MLTLEKYRHFYGVSYFAYLNLRHQFCFANVLNVRKNSRKYDQAFARTIMTRMMLTDSSWAKLQKSLREVGCYATDKHLIENLFARLKQYRAIATRYDKLKLMFEGTVKMGIIAIWLKCAV